MCSENEPEVVVADSADAKPVAVDTVVSDENGLVITELALPTWEEVERWFSDPAEWD